MQCLYLVNDPALTCPATSRQQHRTRHKSLSDRSVREHIGDQDRNHLITRPLLQLYLRNNNNDNNNNNNAAMLPLVQSPALLAPVIALNLWTLFMEAWMYATRIPAVSKYKVPVHPNASQADFNAKIPPHIRWKADNYNHLMEQPTQFYAVAVVLSLLGASGGLDVGLAWSYVAIRVAHSLVHALVNKVMLRFQLFALSSVVLLVLTARAALLVF